jgi:hypothetical protein
LRSWGQGGSILQGRKGRLAAGGGWFGGRRISHFVLGGG